MKKINFYVFFMLNVFIGIFFVMDTKTQVYAATTNGDAYITNSEILSNNTITEITDNKLYMNTKYSLLYEFEIPDNEHHQGDIIEFSIPKQFEVLGASSKELYSPDGEEVATIQVKGNQQDGYYVSMEFTTDYVDTHSNVSGSFRLQFILNEEYVTEGESVTIDLPNKQIPIEIPKDDYTDEGTITGGDGNPNIMLKSVELIHDTSNSTGKYTTYIQWTVELGLDTLLGSHSSVDDIDSIYLSDSPQGQKLVPVSDAGTAWPGSFAIKFGYFKDVAREYSGVDEKDMGLNDSYTSFSVDILPMIKEYIAYNASFEEFNLRYLTVPLIQMPEGSELRNQADVTVKYKNGESNTWILSNQQEWQSIDGSITGDTAAVSFTKENASTNTALAGAVFDLYKDNILIRSGLTSDISGKVFVDKLIVGEYYFKETNPPEGFHLSNKTIPFTITKSDLGTTQTKDLGIFENELEVLKTSYYVNKVWDDNQNEDQLRPTSIQVQLYKNNLLYGEPVELNEGNNWSYTWTDLEGTATEYSVKEVDLPTGYENEIKEVTLGNAVIVNTRHSEKMTIAGKKTWDDNNNEANQRPTKITVYLLANGEQIANQEVTAADNWSYSFDNLDKYDEQGKEITYTVKESPVENYTSTVAGYDITNKYNQETTPEKIAVAGKKTWDDNNNEANQRPTKITVYLLANGEQVASQEVTAADNWSYSFDHLDKYDGQGKEITYTIREDIIADYVSEVSGYDLTNHYNTKKTSVNVTKVWDDENDRDGIRPDKIEVQLYADKLPVGDSIWLNKENHWFYQWDNLDVSKNDKEITYTVKEITSEKTYSSNLTNTQNNIIITNKHEIEKIDLSGEKIWQDDNNQYLSRPDKILIRLLANGKEVATQEVTKENNWQYTFTDLPKNEAGKEIDYRIEEDEIPSYTVEYKKKDTGYTIVNTRIPNVTNITGEKIWKDDDNQAGKRPEKIIVYLLADGQEVDSQTVTQADNWQYTFTNLPEEKDGQKINYEIKEDSVPYYDSKVDGYNLINTYIPNKTSVTVTKKWEDKENQAGARPQAVTVQLYGNGEKIGEEVTLNEENQWMYVWNNLEEATDGKVIVYTVEEISKIPNYKVKVNDEDMHDIIITNTYYEVEVSPATGSNVDSYPNLGSKTGFYLTVVGMILALSIGGLFAIQSKAN